MSSERRAVEAAGRLDRSLSGKPGTDTPTNPYMTAWAHQFEFGVTGPRLEFGILVDVVPGAYCYRVSLGTKSFIYCSPGSADSGFGMAGVRPSHTLPLLSRVFIVRDPETPSIGTIVAVEPHWSVHNGNQPGDGVWPFTRSGLGVEAAHQYPFQASAAAGGSGVVNLAGVEGADLSAGRPYDTTSVGEWGRQTETGLGIHVDPFCAYLRVDEATGVFAFYDDQLLRVAGVNYQFVSSVTEDEQLDDAGELYGYRRRCVYAWEPYGLWRYNQVTPGWSDATVVNHGLAAGQGTRLTDPTAAISGSGYAVREPEQVGQLSAARVHDWYGYLGQGGHSLTAAPLQLEWAYPAIAESARGAAVGTESPSGAPSGRLTVDGAQGPTTQPLAVPANAYGGPDQPGVIEEHKSLAGRWTLRTTRGVLIAKRPSMPTPRPIRQPADPAGDRAGNYESGGIEDNGVTHKVKADPTPTVDAGRRMCLLPDAIAYLFNWENLHPFAYHERDWFVAPEGEAGTAFVNQVPPDYTTLDTLDALGAPPPVFLDVDHRYGLTEVYENESVFAMLDDGSIVIRDGWGSEIRMGGGHIELRTAGDVRLHSGRDVMVWGGYDVVLKAHNSVDVTAAQGDVRTKAERNSHHLAGNSGCGGFLFESKAECASHLYDDPGQDAISSGFVVRCPESTVDVVAADIRLSLDANAPAESRIILDAGDDKSVYVLGQQVTTRVRADGGIVHVFGGLDDVARVDEFTADQAFFGGNAAVSGKMFVGDCLTVDGWVASSVHFASSNSASYSGKVGASAGLAAAVSTAASAADSRVSYLTDTYGPAFDEQTLLPPKADEAEFTCRTPGQYLSESFTFWRSHWEAIADADDQTLTAWVEPEVTGTVSSTVTRPFPGTRWTASGGYKYQSYTFVDTEGWLAVDRLDFQTTYEDGSPEDATSGTLSSLYKVTVPDWYQP